MQPWKHISPIRPTPLRYGRKSRRSKPIIAENTLRSPSRKCLLYKPPAPFINAVEKTRAVTALRRKPWCAACCGGLDLYQIDTAVDLINLASIAYGYSIGGFDAGKIVGDTLVLGIGREGEAYEGIGRGPLNIAGLPVYRDNQGGIGTPTSDHERTKLTLSTTHLLALVNGYDGNREQVLACAEYMQELLKKYAGSDGGNITLY